MAQNEHLSHSHDVAHDHGHDGGGSQQGSCCAFGVFGLEELLNVLAADKLFFAELDPLNNSGAEGAALLALNGDQLTVVTTATGVEAGQVHPQHIHGFEDGRESNVPNFRFDDDRDGFVELAEGEESYGPILLDLTSPPDSGLQGFPTPSGNSFLFAQTYDLSDPERSGDLADLLLEAPLERREIVLHGLTTLEGQGEGTPGEVDGVAEYKAVLPIASGEIEAFDPDQGLAAVSSFVFGQNDLFA